MPKILIIVLAGFIMFAGASITAMQVFELGPFSAPAELSIETLDQKESGTVSAPPRFVDMEPLLIPVFRGNKAVATIQMQLQLETSKENYLKVLKLTRRLDDAFLSDLMGYVPRLLRSSKQLEVDKIKSRLLIIAERTIGKGLIKDILVQSIVDRPNR